jgi:hypothetical protein
MVVKGSEHWPLQFVRHVESWLGLYSIFTRINSVKESVSNFKVSNLSYGPPGPAPLVAADWIPAVAGDEHIHKEFAIRIVPLSVSQRLLARRVSGEVQ